MLASRNSTPATFREVVSRVESGEIDTRPWIKHRLALADVPEVFPKEIAGNPAVLKAMLEVERLGAADLASYSLTPPPTP